MSNLPRPHRLNIDLGAFKEPWISYCAARHITASAAFRQIVAILLNKEGGQVADLDSKTLPGKVRKQVTMTSEEAAFVDNQAGAEGYSSTRWLIALLQARMGNGAQFGQYELEALGRSNLALLALGRNLNQIARSMNAGSSPPWDLIALTNRIDTAIQSHTKQVAEIIARNMDRWNSK
jgi:hypothetical protein